jgi:tetratricopeptide (TPR) repeat protein
MGAVPPMQDHKPELQPADAALIKQRFEQAVALLHAKQYDYAVKALDQILTMQADIPEVYVNLGYAYLGLEQPDTAQAAFAKATDIRPGQANAYYGLAMAMDRKKDYEAALGAMRTFIHLSKPEDPFLAKARAAIWEWEGQLGRIPGVKEVPEGTDKSMLTPKTTPHKRSE